VIPHYNLPAADLVGAPPADASGHRDISPYQSFTIGTVRFLITDLRSEAKKSTETFPGSIYDDGQKAWLYEEIENANNYDFVVWLSSKPWIGPTDVGGDNWQGFAKDRQELSDHIARHIGGGKQNLLVVSSDAHMIAYDDGTNTAYNTNKTFSAGFPILQSGPLHNVGSTKGGPFSEGCFTYKMEMNNQYSTIDFDFVEPANPCLTIKTFSMVSASLEEVLFEKKLCGEIFAPKDAASNPNSSCDGSLLRPATIGLGATTGVLFFLSAAVSLAVVPNKMFVGKVLFATFLFVVATVFIGFALPFSTYISENNFALQSLSAAATSFVIVLMSVAYLVYCRYAGSESSIDSTDKAPSESKVQIQVGSDLEASDE
jgi:hypothetical protein